MDPSSRKSSNKIRDIVRLQQILKKWKKLAHINRNTAAATATAAPSNGGSGSKSIKFLRKTLSFSDISSATSSPASAACGGAVPKGYVAVCVGKELKRFVIRTEYLSHQAFGVLLREAEEEFGFQQEGVLKFPCEVEIFEKILKMMESDNKKKSSSMESVFFLHDHIHEQQQMGGYSSAKSCSPDERSGRLPPLHHPQMCR